MKVSKSIIFLVSEIIFGQVYEGVKIYHFSSEIIFGQVP